MSNSGKMRIYDLAKSLIPDDLTDKEKKILQTQKTKDILEICNSLGLSNKTPSSSLEGEAVAQVVNVLGNKGKINQVKLGVKNSEENIVTSTRVEKSEPQQKKSRILRRITVEKEETPEEESPQVEEKKDIPLNIELLEKDENDIEEVVEENVEEEVEENIVVPSEEIDPPNNAQEEKEVLAKGEQEIKTYSKPFISPIQIVKSENTYTPPSQRHKNVTKEKPFEKNGEKYKGVTAQHSSPHKSNHSSQQKPATSQPYRVAKPINTSFSPIRRKPGQKQVKQKPSQFSKSPFASKEKSQALVQEVERPKELTINHPLTIKELSELMNVQEAEIIRSLFMKGIMRTVNQTLEVDLTIQVAEELGCKITMDQSKTDQSDDLASRLKELVDTHTDEKQSKELKLRPPVVTIMGHVDHGKTTLLDSIRKSKKQITSTESGGITQHIGAYQISVQDYDDKERKITFLDTPGHEAFTALRARGAQATDIAILVVAADDGVMPQTIEAISHVKAAGVPLIVAVNKVDKPDSAPDRVLSQLIEHEVVVEDYGGQIVCSKISAKQNLNLDDLLSKITLVADAELGDKLLANPTSRAVGAVVEAALTANRGTVTSLLVQSGTLKKGDTIAAGAAFGRVRAIFDDEGHEIDEAPPATPVQILGLDSVPQAGDTFQVFKNLQKAKAQAESVKEQSISQKRMNRGLEYFSSEIREGSVKELSVIIKADVHGSAEAIANELNKLSSDQALVKIIHCAAGAVTETDVNLASATGAIIVNFNTLIDSVTSKAASENNVPVYDCNIIYEITESVRKAINGLLEPEKIEIKHGESEVRQVFSVGKSKIAGSYVLSGKMVRGSTAKVFRNGRELISTRLDNLKRFKDDVKEVLENFECGISFDSFNDIEEGDIIESWGTEFQERTI
ncbi:MAG: translation initiation factor IF-2 [Candidatus Caenarcaniphilales bacterium]|nr:translation initiation factor IF-2 [Candidatus Caenarcaniphilales bacterium]